MTIDFDAFLAEERATREPKAPIMLKIGGKEYPLPLDLPAIIALDIIRLKKSMDSDKETPTETLMGIGDALFGHEVFRQILIDNQLGVPDLGNLITQSFGAYGELVQTGDAVPNLKAPTRKRST